MDLGNILSERSALEGKRKLFMKNSIIERKLIDFIKEYSEGTSLYWAPLTRLKKDIPVVSYHVDAIYKNNDIALLENVFKTCGISEVNTFQMDHLEYFEHENIFELLYEKDDDEYSFPWYVETFYFDSSETWMVYVSHEGTISFTGKEIVKAAIENIDNLYRTSQGIY